MRLTFIVKVIWFLVLSAPALAQSPTDTLKRFGLVGVWSSDCSKSVRNDLGVWTIFYFPGSKRPRLVVVVKGTQVSVIQDGEVVEAVPVESDKLRYTWQPKEVTYADGRSPNSNDLKAQVGLYRKVNNQLWILDNRTADGSDIFIENGRVRVDSSFVKPWMQCSTVPPSIKEIYFDALQ